MTVSDNIQIGYPHTPLTVVEEPRADEPTFDDSVSDETVADQLEAIEQKLDDLLTFIGRLTPLVEYAEKMMHATKKEQLKMFLGKSNG